MKPLSLLLLALFLTACASRNQPGFTYPISPMMATAYSGGAMTITWKSTPEVLYTVFYTDAPRGKVPDWKPLPQANKLKGTGEQISISDTVAPDSPRRYLLLTGDQKPY